MDESFHEECKLFLMNPEILKIGDSMYSAGRCEISSDFHTISLYPTKVQFVVLFSFSQ